MRLDEQQFRMKENGVVVVEHKRSEVEVGQTVEEVGMESDEAVHIRSRGLLFQIRSDTHFSPSILEHC